MRTAGFRRQPAIIDASKLVSNCVGIGMVVGVGSTARQARWRANAIASISASTFPAVSNVQQISISSRTFAAVI